MINIKLNGLQCYLLSNFLEGNADFECPIIGNDFEDLFVELYIQWLSQDIHLHEMLLRNTKNPVNPKELK